MGKSRVPNASKVGNEQDVDESMVKVDCQDDQADSDVPNGDFEFDSEEDELNDNGIEDDEELEDLSDDDMDEMSEGGVPLGRAISPSTIPLLNPVAEDPPLMSASGAATDIDSASLHPQKPTPYVHDSGLLMVTDPNPLPQTTAATREAILASNARDAAQSLFNHLLTTCSFHSVAASSASSSGVLMSLPPPEFHLPREKKIPMPKPPTKWEQFAARKGIGHNNKKGGVGKDGQLHSTEGKMVYDEASGEWVPKWGYKGKNKKGEGDWLVEVDNKKEAKTGEAGDGRADDRAARKERVKRNERLQRSNERRARKGVPKA